MEFQKHFFNESHKHGIKEDGRHKKTSSKQKWTNRYYHVQNSKYVDHQYLKMYCEKKQFPGLKFLGQHNKPHGVCGLCKHCHICFDPKLGHGICAILLIPCYCPPFTSMHDQP